MRTLVPIAILFLGVSCLADTIRLRNGTELEGVIISEEADHYVAMVNVTKTIRDQRKIPKKDVLEIVAEKKDELAFEKIKGLLPTPDLLGPEEYERMIEDTADFLSKHSGSPLASEAKEILAELEKEKAVVSAGGVKFEGKLIPADERTKKAYTLDSLIVANTVRTEGDAGRRTAALRAWSELEKNFKTSRAFIDTKPYAISLMKSQLAAINKELATFDQRKKEREDGIARIPAKDRDRTQRILREQEQNYLSIIAAEKEAGIRWISLNPDHKEPMVQMQNLLEREIQRLEKLETSQLPDGDHAWEEAWELLQDSPTPEDGRAALAAARKGQLPPAYLEKLEALAPQK